LADPLAEAGYSACAVKYSPNLPRHWSFSTQSAHCRSAKSPLRALAANLSLRHRENHRYARREKLSFRQHAVGFELALTESQDKAADDQRSSAAGW
jgi:hypothetical protein